MSYKTFQFSSREELMEFLKEEVVNTSEAIKILGCSRQNLSQLIKSGSLTPIRESSKERFFLKTDVLNRKEKRRK